jgi:3-deoxy-manno-octulosonate cytidylyltransferase (CMP-KDO synthetase)
MSPTIGIIPARMQSSRLPGKMLLSETGKPLIRHTWEAACRARSLDRVIIATDSDRIAETARAFGAEAALTGEHPSGTDRIAEVVRSACPDAALVVNIQGDEPELEPGCIDKLVTAMRARTDVEMGTLATPIDSLAQLQDTGCVKVVCAADGRALYFSRLPIPFYRDGDPAELLDAAHRIDSSLRASSSPVRSDESEDPGAPSPPLSPSPWLLHLGIYAYRPSFLLALTRMPPSRLEQLEKLEQLRALEAGASILVKVVPHRSVGIDTAADYAAFVARCREQVEPG